MDNNYFIRCELKEQSLEKFASDLELLRRVAMAPGEPYRFNWSFGAISRRVDALSNMLAQEPENSNIRTILQDYCELKNQVWRLVMEPPYGTFGKVRKVAGKRKLSIRTLIRKIAAFMYIVNCCILSVQWLAS